MKPRGFAPAAIVLAAACLSAAGDAAPPPPPSTATTVQLGSKPTLAALFGCEECTDAALTGLIQHYAEQSAARGGAQVQVGTVTIRDTWQLPITGQGDRPAIFASRLTQFLTIAEEGRQLACDLQRQGTWQPEWRFLPPLGLPLTGQRAVLLMHFPPPTALTTHDYLATGTSRRWEGLLMQNGAHRSRLPRYENLVDVVPIAAPADTGDALAATMATITPYARDMLAFALAGARGGGSLPVVAFGRPARAWLEAEQHVALPVLGLARVTMGSGPKVSVLGANHPSYLWYAAKHPRALALKVMERDLVAACWELAMAHAHPPDPAAALAHCAARWHVRATDICVLTAIQAFDEMPEQGRQECTATTTPGLAPAQAVSDEEAARLEREAPVQ